MNFLKNLNINTRLNLIFSTVLIVVFFFIGLFLYQSEKNKILVSTKELMVNEIKELNSIIDSQVEKENKKINIALRTLNFIYQQYGKVNEKNTKIQIEAVNITSLESEDIEINEWELNSENIFRNESLTEQVKVITGAYISIMQKIPDGYIFLTSNIPENLNERRVFYLPNTSKIVYTIEKGENFTGEVKIFDNVYKMSARPIYINGEIKGMLTVAYEVGFSDEVINFFGSKTYFKAGYPFIADKDGNVIIHPRLQGENISNTTFFKNMKEAKYSNEIIHFKYKWPENRNGEQKYMHVKYIPNVKYYIATTYRENELLEVVNKLKINITLAVLVSSFSVIIIVYLIINSLTKRITKISESVKLIATGKIPNKIKIRRNDELGELRTNVNIVIENKENLKLLTDNLKNKNLDFKYEKANKDDVIENNLVELKNNLKKEEELEKIRKYEKEIEEWKAKGLSNFIEILKFQDTEFEELTYDIISNVVKYLGATQGGFFIMDNNYNRNQYLELVACYAYSRKKIVEKRVSANSGLLGRVVIEKKYLHITELPKNYTKISSTLGESIPNSLIIMPLIFNNELLGILEIASFNKFEKHHINFLEDIAGNIASTISGIKNTKRTEELLKESQKQSSLMEKQKTELQKNIKQLEKISEDSETREIEMKSIVKAIESTALIVEFDINGKIISTNDKFAKVLKQSKEKIVGKNHRNITSMNINSADYYSFWNDLIAGKSKKFIESLTVEDRLIWLSQNYTPILSKNKKVYKIMNIAIDITENKYLEKQLRSQVKEISREARGIRKEQRKIKKERKEMEELKNQFDTLKQDIDNNFIQIELSSNGIVLKINKKGLKTLKVNADKIIGEDIKVFISEKDRVKYQSSLSLLKLEKQAEDVICFVKKDNEILKLKIIQQSVTDEKTRIRRISMLATEV